MKNAKEKKYCENFVSSIQLCIFGFGFVVASLFVVINTGAVSINELERKKQRQLSIARNHNWIEVSSMHIQILNLRNVPLSSIY